MVPLAHTDEPEQLDPLQHAKPTLPHAEHWLSVVQVAPEAHTLLAQQPCPVAPQLPHVPPVPQLSPFAHCCPAQQGCPGPPQARHALF